MVFGAQYFHYVSSLLLMISPKLMSTICLEATQITEDLVFFFFWKFLILLVFYVKSFHGSFNSSCMNAAWDYMDGMNNPLKQSKRRYRNYNFQG